MEKIKSILKGEDSKSKSDTSTSSGRNEMSSTSGTQHGSSISAGTQQGSSTSASTQQRSTPSNTTSRDVAAETYETQDQLTAPAVQHETVSKTHQDVSQAVLDREQHVDHYHTTAQPLTDRVVEPEKHSARQAETQYREFEHGDKAKTEAALAKQAAQFKDTRVSGGTTATSSDLGTVVNSETTHHHLHETVQPVIEREIIQPSVTHTTVPIHEVHRGTAHIHDTSVAKPMPLSEFNKLTGDGSTGTKDVSRGN